MIALLTKERARELLDLRGPYGGGVRPSKSDPPSHPWYAEDLRRGRAEERGITEAEDLEVRRLWNAGPGSASWSSTLCAIAYPREG